MDHQSQTHGAWFLVGKHKQINTLDDPIVYVPVKAKSEPAGKVNRIWLLRDLVKQIFNDGQGRKEWNKEEMEPAARNRLGAGYVQ